VHVIVAVQHVGLDEGVGRQLALGGVLQELLGRDEIGRATEQPGGVDHAGERHDAVVIAVDAPAQPLRFQAFEDRLRRVVHREGIRGDHVGDEAGRRSGVEERPIGEGL
jgi:hypothetical protein